MRQPRPRARTRPAAPPPAEVVTVTRIGGDGDGVAQDGAGRTLYIPFTLPGETVEARPLRPHGQGWLAQVESWTSRTAERIAPPCPRFGECGGCALQHWDPAAYGAWKSGLLAAALRRAGFADAVIDELVAGSPHTRRRMDLAARRTRAGVILGLHRQRGHEVVDLDDCAVLHPALAALLQPIRDALGGLDAPWRQASVIANLLDSGPDLLLRLDADPTVADRAALAGFAATHGLPRVSLATRDDDPEPVATLRPPETRLSGVTVRPPPGAFLQATEAGEAAIRDAVLAGLPDRLKGTITECHAGCGTLTFALATRAPVRAWEGDAAAVAALTQAVNRSSLAGRIQAGRRDLVRQPLLAADLKDTGVVVLDPPHAGAAELMAPLAASGVGTVIYVSCNPAALARDAAVLRAAGHRLVRATPIDQFLWSPRLESVCVFRRERA